MSELNNINTDIKLASIMVVDDEEANVRLIEKILQRKGYTDIVCTEDPMQVITLYKKKQCDLIILDLNMPILDGYAVMEQLNIHYKDNLPAILVLSAQDMQSFRQRALDSGARDYVTKPFDMNELLSRVRNLLEVQMAHKFMRYQKKK